MIVLKSTQEKVLAVLQSVSGIVERRHTLPILASVLIKKKSESLVFQDLDNELCGSYETGLSGGDPFLFSTFFAPRNQSNCYRSDTHSAMANKKQSPGLNLPKSSYFESKVNGRNAP